ncbi:glycosyltransferase family 4 protein [Nocardioides conyzicola]|uniref:Glycosyltransferase family 4 protein n=1 Tax=Nocardioides conyzicola TaxID=1651781 RepID=A0ABP8Y565_9ACTN
MRLVFLTWRDSTHPDGGGSEIFVEEVARELVARGHEVTIRCARHPGSAPAEDLDGVRLVRRGGRLTVYPRALAWLATRGRRYDVVVDVINGLPFGAPLVRRHGVVALIHHTHERQWQIIYPDVRGRIGWAIEHRLTPRLYRGLPHLTVSDASRADLVGIGVPESSISVVRNGVRVVPATAARSATPRLVVLTRLVPHKQVEDAFHVLARLRDELPDLRLDVVGEGWWRPHLEEALRELRLEDWVTLHGHVPDDVRDRILAEAWVMLLPSVKEGWGLAIMEAAAQGTPTIAYGSAGGVRESILDGETGLLVDDRDGLTEATRSLLVDAGLRDRLGRAARERARTFSWSSAADVVEDVAAGASAQSP